MKQGLEPSPHWREASATASSEYLFNNNYLLQQIYFKKTGNGNKVYHYLIINENRLGLKMLLFSFQAFYYFAMVEDLIFRLLWTLTVSVGQLEIFHSEILKLILSVCEVFR